MKTQKQAAAEQISKWGMVDVRVLNGQTGEVISRHIETAGEAVSWQANSDSDARILAGRTVGLMVVHQTASTLGTVRELSAADVLADAETEAAIDTAMATAAVDQAEVECLIARWGEDHIDPAGMLDDERCRCALTLLGVSAEDVNLICNNYLWCGFGDWKSAVRRRDAILAAKL